VLIGGGHSNALLIHKWLMRPVLRPKCHISIISRDFNLFYSAMYPGVIAGEFKIDETLIDIYSLANRAKISFIKDEISNINFLQKKVLFHKRPFIQYSNVVLNFGSETKIDAQFKDLVESKIAFPIKPFYDSYKKIVSEDINDDFQELPFVIVGSGLAAIEISFALRKRWSYRKIILVCDQKKINNQIFNKLRKFNIYLKEKIDFDYGKILLCTGNQCPSWLDNNLLKLDKKGRIYTNSGLQVNEFPNVFAVGDCAVSIKSERPASGVFAVRAANTLAINLKKDLEGKTLKNWFPQKRGLQIVKTFNGGLETFSFFGKLTVQSSTLFGNFKNNIDKNFIKKFKLKEMKSEKNKKQMENFDCRGCGAKISQNVLNNSLMDSKLEKFAEFPEDASEVIKFDNKILLQSVDGFPALISDPWLNARITTLHSCSDLWACGVKVSSINTLISLPKVENDFQNYLCTHSLNGINSVVDDIGAKVIGGHTYESRNFSDSPYSLGIDISLTVNGYLGEGKKPWQKSGMRAGDIIFMSRPLGVGIFFAAQMRNINLFKSSFEVFQNLLTSQQKLIEDIDLLQHNLGENIINASTDVTGFGLLGHLKEMVDASNKFRIKKNQNKIRALIDLSLVRAYPQILELINIGIKSSLYEGNRRIYEKIITNDFEDQSIIFVQNKKSIKKEFSDKLELLLDPQTCGPLLISCNPIYEEYLKENWYRVGVVV
tara:strand:- start:8519 stop:10663 length:2145 start_codon:yes stop_codon:yes gene_type:complete